MADKSETPTSFPIFPAAIGAGILAVIFAWAGYVDHQKTVRREQQAEARRQELATPVAGAGGVSVRILAECGKDEYREKYHVEKVARDGEWLMVQLAASESCGPRRAVQPRAEIAGDTVTLGWVWQSPGGAPGAACLCTRHLEFRIPGVPPGDPRIVVAEEFFPVIP